MNKNQATEIYMKYFIEYRKEYDFFQVMILLILDMEFLQLRNKKLDM